MFALNRYGGEEPVAADESAALARLKARTEARRRKQAGPLRVGTPGGTQVVLPAEIVAGESAAAGRRARTTVALAEGEHGDRDGDNRHESRHESRKRDRKRKTADQAALEPAPASPALSSQIRGASRREKQSRPGAKSPGHVHTSTAAFGDGESDGEAGGPATYLTATTAAVDDDVANMEVDQEGQLVAAEEEDEEPLLKPLYAPRQGGGAGQQAVHAHVPQWIAKPTRVHVSVAEARHTRLEDSGLCPAIVGALQRAGVSGLFPIQVGRAQARPPACPPACLPDAWEVCLIAIRLAAAPSLPRPFPTPPFPSLLKAPPAARAVFQSLRNALFFLVLLHAAFCARTMPPNTSTRRTGRGHPGDHPRV